MPLNLSIPPRRPRRGAAAAAAPALRHAQPCGGAPPQGQGPVRPGRGPWTLGPDLQGLRGGRETCPARAQQPGEMRA